jgi:xanthine dehydrogenase accessory factor
MIRAELAERAEQELISGGVPFVEATVVRAQSPTPVRPGDTAIVRGDGTIEGFVGGACAETSVRLHALRVLETGEPLLLRILPGEGEGVAGPGEGAVTVKNPCLSGGALEIFLEPWLPAPTIRVVGQSPIALALADLGKRLGYAVELSVAENSEPSSGDAAVVVASHGQEEERVLTAALRAGVPYVGLVASQIRGDSVRNSLDLPNVLRAQLQTPAGLEIGAHTPEEIALAILAEIVAFRRSGGGRASGEPLATAGARRRDDPSSPAPPPTVAPAQPSTQVALDPVCGMEVAISEASIQLELNGERHYFCSEGCRDGFAAEHAPGVGVP